MFKKLLFIAAFVTAAIFTSCNTQPSQGANTTGTTSVSVNSKIVYVDIDSLVKGYKMFQDINAVFIKKAEGIQRDLDQKGSTFQKKVASYENKVKNGLITRNEAMTLEQELQQEQQQLVQYRDQILGQISEEEQVMLNKIKYNIQEFIKKYNDVKKYDLILSNSVSTGTVLASQPELNITSDIMAGMNAEYVPEKQK